MASTNSGGMVYTERVRDCRIIKQIVYGNRAVLLPQKNEKGHTHRWTVSICIFNHSNLINSFQCFIRPYDKDEDLSAYIRKVQFRLHESYANSVRMVEKPPFELTETGWGEFDIQVFNKIYILQTDKTITDQTLFHRCQRKTGE